ncbi:MAG: BON domain-containing protein [Terracidiphilus sp.]
MKAICKSLSPIGAVLLTGALLSLPPMCLGAATGRSDPIAQGQENNSLDSAAMAKLKKSQFKDVKVSVDGNGIATLAGTVGLYEYKVDAQKRVNGVKGVTAVRNDIEVAGPSVSDQQLQQKLGEALAYDRVGYGNVFNAITLQVHDGIAALGGHAHDYPDRDSAVALASTTPGVKGVIDDIEVDPTSMMDWQTRMATARAIYGYPSLNKYAIDPAKPIRISVQNGHVKLYGTVDSQADKETAYIRANGVPGVFSVENYLQVANQPTESSKK